MTFSYEEFTSRNLGFVSAAEQERLRRARIFIPGVGGMGGTAIQCLARAGVGHFIFADLDTFELSNLNRQMGAFTDTMDREKSQVTEEILRRINPEIATRRYGAEWVEQISAILGGVDLALNGCDDARATIALMRAASSAGITVIDAFCSPLPSVYVVAPGDPRPEETFGYPSLCLPLEQIDADVAAGCLQKEIEWVLTHSSSADHVDMEMAMEVAAGQRKRMSFAPMVWATGTLMAYEAIRALLGRPGGPGPAGRFFNPWTWAVE